MPTTVQFRRGTTAQNNAFTGAVGELSVDTDKQTLIVHDGSTAGGSALLSGGGATQSITSSTTNTPAFSFVNTTDDATGPVITIQNDRATPADNDVAGTVKFVADDDAGAEITVASLTATITDVSNGTEDGKLVLAVEKAGTTTDTLTLDPTGVTVNAGILVAPTGSTVGNLTLANGSITDSSGTISFGDENLTTTGTLTAATGSSIGNLTLANGSITDSSGTIDFGNENLTTSGNITATGATVTSNIIDTNIIQSTDSSALQINEAINVSGAITGASTINVTGNATFGGTGTFTSTISSATGSTIGNLTLANGSITDSSGTISFGDENLTTTGTITYGTLNDGSNNITSTAAELNIMDGDTAATSTTLADADRVVVNDAGVMKQVALTDFETYFETALDTLSNVTTVGALNSGSITSGFGSINVGSSAITTTGTITGGIGVFDNIRIDNTAGEIDTSSGNLTIDSAGGTVTVDDNLSVSGNATITGNLTVNGTTTTVATTNTVVSDTLIELGNGTTGTPANDAGIVIERGDSNNAFIGFDESADKFIVGTGTFTGASTGNLTITTGTLVANLEGNVTGNVTGDVTGNADTATALATGRTIGLSGDVTATGVSFDGTGNITLSTTIAANSVALGTDTTGNYVGTITGGTGIASTGATSGEGIAHTLSVDLSELTDMTATMVGTDEFIVLDAGADRRKAANEIGLSIFNNDSGFTTNTGTVTSVGTTGSVNGITLTGTVTTSGNLTLGGSLSGITTSQFAAAAFKDEDNMASNSASAVASQQSIKAYVDNSIGAISSNSISAGNTSATITDAGTGNMTVTVDGTTHSVFAAAGITLSQGNFVGTSTSAQYADLAEMYSADAEYEPGTVMSFGGDQEITQSVQSHDARVAGVVSTAPAYLMNADLENGTALALQGRTPVKVIGRIHKGDMLVASQTPGVACAVDTSFYTPGCVIGKALESYDSQSVGLIEVVVGRI